MLPSQVKMLTLSNLGFDVPADVHVAQIDFDFSRDLDDEVCDVLNSAEKARAKRFVNHEDRIRFAFTRAVLRHCLASRCRIEASELEFGYSSSGRPHLTLGTRQQQEVAHLLADPPRIVDFNVSHSGDHALLAWSHCRAIGIDIERHCADTNLRNLFSIVLGDGDLREIEQRGSRHERELFYDIWVAKEALLKASGLGITVGLERFSVASRRRHEVVVSGDRKIAAALDMFRAAWIGIIAGYSVSIAWGVDGAALSRSHAPV